MKSNQSAMRAYLVSKIDDLEHKIFDKKHNIKRLQAQRNDLNNQGSLKNILHLNNPSQYVHSVRK